MRLLRFLVVFVVALGGAPLLPLFVERTVVRSWQAGGAAADRIDWGWRLRPLTGFWSDYRYLRPEQHPAFWLGLNLALLLAYALAAALLVDYLFARRARARGRGSRGETFTRSIF